MNRDKKIEAINAYRKLLDRKLKVGSKDEELKAEVLASFKTWVESRLRELMGETRPSLEMGQFTKEELAVLKGMARKLLAKAEALPSSPRQTQKAPQPPSTNSDPTIQAGTTKGIVQDPDEKRLVANRKLFSAADSVTDALDKMDQEGPEF